MGCEKQTLQKTAASPRRKKWPTFSAVTEHGRSQATFFKPATCLQTMIVQAIRSFIQQPIGRWIYKLSRKS